MRQVYTFHYQLLDDYENVLESSYKQEPITFVVGGQQIIEEVEKELLNLEVGEKTRFRVSSSAIFSTHNKGKSREVTRSDLSQFSLVRVGDQISLQEAGGHVVPYIVTFVGKDRVRLLSCGLFSREDYTFSVELLGRRSLTDGEIFQGTLKKMYISR